MNTIRYATIVVSLMLLAGCADEAVGADIASGHGSEALAAYGALAIEVLAQPVHVEARADGSMAALREPTRSEGPASDTMGRSDAVVVGVEPGDVVLYVGGLPALRVREDGASGPIERLGGAIVRGGARARRYWTLAPRVGAEEWLDFEEGVAFGHRAVAHWTVDGATVRELPNDRGIEVLGEDGEPIVHVSAPRARTDDGDDVRAQLRVEANRIALYVDARGRRVLVDPLWVPTGAMLTARALGEAANVAVELDGGIVWAGGSGVGSTALATAERYDIATGVWNSLPDLPFPPRRGHVAAALPDGRLFVFGGNRNDSAAIFDPRLESWRTLPPLTGSWRTGSQATSLLDGRVLITGGWTGTDYADPAQLFDPASDSWTSAGSIGIGRYWHAAARLEDGRVLIAGGTVYSGTGDPRFNATTTATARVYDPVTGTWSSAGTLSQPRTRPRAVLLQTGRVLVVGGSQSSVPSTTADLYNPVTGTWSATGSLSIGRDYHSLTLLPDGRVLAAGGSGPTGVLTTTEIYSPVTGTWTSGPSLRMPRADHASALLPGGRVLVAGGGTGPRSVDGITATSEVLVEDTCGDGVLQPGEGCDDGNNTNDDCCSAACTIEVAGTVCRPGTGCDATERCDGVSATCPADALAGAGAVCRAAAGACDISEVCDGVSAACPADVLAPAGEVCRAAVGECDAIEVCSGASPACPADAAQPDGSVCGPAPSGECDVADACVGAVGADAYCEPRYRVAGTVCRAAAGECDVPEHCAGDSTACPPDAFLALGTICRPLAGACDLAEACSGDSAFCPPDALRALGEVCRTAAGDCDVAETCTGDATECPSDLRVTAGSVCRPAAGECDVAEVCSGAASCPVDTLAEASVVCRASVGECDAAETCSGVDATCPSDSSLEGASCGELPSDLCDATDVCVGLVGASARCEARLAPAATECRAARCEEGLEEPGSECDGTSVECPLTVSRSCWPYTCGESACLTSCTTDDECVPGAHCTAGSCVVIADAGPSLDGGSNDAAAGELDGGPEPPPDAAQALDSGAVADAGQRVDAGVPVSAGGCGCRASGSRHGGLPAFLAVALLAATRRRPW